VRSQGNRFSTKNIYPDFTIEMNPGMINNPRNQRSIYPFATWCSNFTLATLWQEQGLRSKQ